VSEANGIERIAEAFESSARESRAALMPYLMGGFPDLARSQEIGAACIEGGADVIELGLPFSDPLADGPVIHAAGTAALRAGATFAGVLEIAAALAPRIPVIVMAYANSLFVRGVGAAAGALAEAGACGLIVPDLPHEEAGELRGACDARGLALVPLVAPTTPAERLAEIGAHARGFLYTVSVTGTTGERERPADALVEVIARARSSTAVPVAVGFGIGSPAAAADAARAGADGVIVGSRLVRAATDAQAQGASEAAVVRALVRELRAALDVAGAATPVVPR